MCISSPSRIISRRKIPISIICLSYYLLKQRSSQDNEILSISGCVGGGSLHWQTRDQAGTKDDRGRRFCQRAHREQDAVYVDGKCRRPGTASLCGGGRYRAGGAAAISDTERCPADTGGEC